MRNYLRLNSIFIPIIALFLVLSACGSSQSGAVTAIEDYIRAESDQNEAQVSNLSCASWEVSALVEVDSLAGVGSKVENLACQQAGQNGADTYVLCTGVLALNYNGEAQQIDLSSRTYIARQEGGEWRMCGYK